MLNFKQLASKFFASTQNFKALANLQSDNGINYDANFEYNFTIKKSYTSLRNFFLFIFAKSSKKMFIKAPKTSKAKKRSINELRAQKQAYKKAQEKKNASKK
jgi:hypothetical protein